MKLRRVSGIRIVAMGKKPDARKLLGALMTADVNVLPDPDLRSCQQSADQARLRRIDQLNRTGTVPPETSLRLVCEMAGTSPLIRGHLIVFEVRKSEP